MSQELKAARKTRSDEAGPFSISRRFFESGPGSQNGKDAAALHVPFCHSLSLRKQELDELPRRSKAHGRGRGKCLQVIQPGSLEIWYYSWLPHPGKYGNLVLWKKVCKSTRQSQRGWPQVIFVYSSTMAWWHKPSRSQQHDGLCCFCHHGGWLIDGGERMWRQSRMSPSGHVWINQRLCWHVWMHLANVGRLRLCPICLAWHWGQATSVAMGYKYDPCFSSSVPGSRRLSWISGSSSCESPEKLAPATKSINHAVEILHYLR